MRLAWVYLIFLVSGVAGLGYQMAFVRMFAVGLGHEMPAVLAVVGAFFGGLALGAWALDKPIARSARPGRWYVGLEVVVGLWGLGCVWLVGPANELALALMGEQPGFVRQWGVSLGVPLVVLLPATAAMGATLPAMERFAAPLSRSGRCVGGLYAVNTLGAVIGTLAGAFYLVPMLGYRTSVMTLAATDLLCAAAMLPLLRRGGPGVVTPAPPGLAVDPTATRGAPPRGRVLTILFFTGLLGIGYEIVGLRVLAQVIENTVYSYAAALSIFLIGTAIGAAAYQRWISGRAALPFDRVLGYLLCGLAGTCLLGAIGLSRSREIYQAARLALGETIPAVMLSEMAVAATVFLLPTLLMGAAFSHLTEAAKGRDGGVGRAVAINTAGGFIAPLLVGVMLMPALGTKWALVAVSLGYLALMTDYAAVGRWALLAPLALVLLLPADLRLVRTFEGQRVIDYREGVMASVAVIEDGAGHRFLRVNNRFQMGGTSPTARRGQLRLGHVPLLLHPRPERALFLGMGTGMSALAATEHPGVTADAVELVPQVVAVMPGFAIEGRHALNQKGLRVVTADARRFIRTTDRAYDVIVADLFHPARDGGGMLYTREHFEAIRDRLGADGLFCQWLPAYQLDLPTLRLIVRTFLEVFPDARMVMHDVELNHPAIGLIGVRGDWPAYGRGWWDRRVADPALRRRVAAQGLDGEGALFGLHLAEADLLRRFAADGPTNTDDRPRVVFQAPRFAAQRRPTSYGRLLAVIDFADAEADTADAPRWGMASPALQARLERWVSQRDQAIRRAAAAAAAAP